MEIVKLTKDQFIRHRSILRAEFFTKRRFTFDLKDATDFYCSEHVVERIIERNLVKDKMFIIGICKWFMQNVFYSTTYTNRSYQVSIKNLKCCFAINLGAVSGSRFATLTTVFESTEDYNVDEIIKLKF